MCIMPNMRTRLENLAPAVIHRVIRLDASIFGEMQGSDPISGRNRLACTPVGIDRCCNSSSWHACNRAVPDDVLLRALSCYAGSQAIMHVAVLEDDVRRTILHNKARQLKLVLLMVRNL